MIPTPSDPSDPSPTPQRGCSLDPSGHCTIGEAGELPVAGPYTNYAAMGGGLDCCLVDSTLIRMGDGSQIAMSSLQVGDEVLGKNQFGHIRKQTVTHLETVVRRCVEITFGQHSVTCSLGHLFFLRNGNIISARELIAGLHDIQLESGGMASISSITDAGDQNVVNLSLTPNKVYFAGALVTKAKNQTDS